MGEKNRLMHGVAIGGMKEAKVKMVRGRVKLTFESDELTLQC